MFVGSTPTRDIYEPVWRNWKTRCFQRTDVGSSNLFTGIYNGMYVNLVDGVIWDHEAAGSNPVIPIFTPVPQLEDGTGSNPVG